MIEDEANNLDNLKPSLVQGLDKTYNPQNQIPLARPVRNDTYTIFASEIEDKLFHLLTDNISKYQRR